MNNNQGFSVVRRATASTASSSQQQGFSWSSLSRPHLRPFVFTEIDGSFKNISSDFMCPVCFDILKEAHATICGHTFCYSCISQSIKSLGKCPKCQTTLNKMDLIFPNILINDLVDKHKAALKAGNETDKNDEKNSLKQYLKTESSNFSLPDINIILEILNQRKLVLEAESTKQKNELLLSFLHELLEKKKQKLAELNRDVNLISKDIKEVEKALKEVDNACSDINTTSDVNMVNESVKVESTDDETFVYPKKTEDSITFAARKKRLEAHFEDVVSCYFRYRSKELHFNTTEDSLTNLEEFRENLVRFSRYKCLRSLATLNYSPDMFNHSTIVSSIEFDKDNEFFAIAGVTKRIKIYDFGAVIRDINEIHYPALEMVSNSKLSCISWNAYYKNTIASSDYEGSITLWDTVTAQRIKMYQEHQKRCWSVDFNEVDSRLIASGSDDATVKIWSLNTETSVGQIEAKANVCCVKFNPTSAYYFAFGSADHSVSYCDLRKMKEPVCVYKGHKKAVSYVKFLNREEIVSSSTDSQLKMWNVNNSVATIRTFTGHINEKNFVGLAIDDDYIACGSENNSLYIYYKGLPKPMFSYKFPAIRSILDKDKKEDDVNEFVSAVCWRQRSNVIVCANSQGMINLLEIV